MMSHHQHREMCKVTKEARVHLKYLCEKALQKNDVCMDQLAEQRETENLIQIVELILRYVNSLIHICSA